MILIDFSAIAIGNIVSQKIDFEENEIRSMILTSIKMYRKKYKAKYGEVVLAIDAGGNWRKEVFSLYKAKRAIDREADTRDWEAVWPMINGVIEDIQNNFPYKVIKVHGCEGDDVIGVLAEYTNEFGNYEDIMIISADKDFAQLQKYPNINQFSTITKKAIVEKNPHDFLFTHICKGDGSDGVPNVMSPDDIFFQDGVRQGTMFVKKINEWAASDDMRKSMGEEVYRNFCRNKKMIDLAQTPQHLKDQVIEIFETQKVAAKSKVMPYLIKKRARMLLEDINGFIS